MAFISSAIPQEQQNQFTQAGTTTPNPLALLPPQAGGSVGAGSGGAPSPTQATSTQFGTSASKLSDYLNANADQAANAGAKIAGTLNDQYGQIKGGLDSAIQNFGGQVQSGYTPLDQGTLNGFQANPTQFASDPNNVSKFQSMYNDQYGGPANFESTAPYADIQNQVQQAVSDAGQITSAPGLSTYLNTKSQGTYTPGMNMLDTVILGGSPGAMDQIKSAAAPFQGLNQYLTDQTSQANAQVPVAQQSAQAARDAARGAAAPVVGQFNDALNQTVAQDEAARTAYNNNLASIQSGAQGSGGGLTPAQIKMMNINYPEFAKIDQNNALMNQLYGGAGAINLANFLTGNLSPANTPATATNVATPEQYQESQALSALFGQDFSNPIQGQPPAQPWALPQSNIGLNTGGALEQSGGALKADDLTGIAKYGNPTLGTDANGNPAVMGATFPAGDTNPQDAAYFQNILSVLQRLANPSWYTNVDASLTPPQDNSGVTLGGGTGGLGYIPTSGGGKAFR